MLQQSAAPLPGSCPVLVVVSRLWATCCLTASHQRRAFGIEAALYFHKACCGMLLAHALNLLHQETYDEWFCRVSGLDASSRLFPKDPLQLRPSAVVDRAGQSRAKPHSSMTSALPESLTYKGRCGSALAGGQPTEYRLGSTASQSLRNICLLVPEMSHSCWSGQWFAGGVQASSVVC